MTAKGKHVAYGTLTADGDTDEVYATGFVTCSAHYDSGTGNVTWKFKGPDGVERIIYAGATGETAQEDFTSSHMLNFYFADTVRVFATLDSSSSPQIDWQIMSNPRGRSY